MIFCNNTIYGKVWSVTKNDEYVDLKITTSEKAQDGTYKNSSWFPRLIGHAFNSLKDTIKAGDKIIITKSKFTNERYKKDDEYRSSFKFLVFEATVEEGSEATETVAEEATTATQGTTEENNSSPW